MKEIHCLAWFIFPKCIYVYSFSRLNTFFEDCSSVTFTWLSSSFQLSLQLWLFPELEKFIFQIFSLTLQPWWLPYLDLILLRKSPLNTISVFEWQYKEAVKYLRLTISFLFAYFRPTMSCLPWRGHTFP